MIIDFKLEGKNVVVIGGGKEGYKKLIVFLKSGAKILVVSRSIVEGIKKLHQNNRLDVLKADIMDGEAFVRELSPKPDLLVAATNDQNLNNQLVRQAKALGCMVYDISNSATSDFMFPAVTNIGDVKIAVSTSGKSPTIARMLKERIEKIVTQEDLLEIKLQSEVRTMLKQNIKDQKTRKKILHKIINDKHVKSLLKEGKLEEAKKVSTKIIKTSLNGQRVYKNASSTKDFQEIEPQ